MVLPHGLDDQPACGRFFDRTAHFLTPSLDSRERGGPTSLLWEMGEGLMGGREGWVMGSVWVGGGGVKGKLIAVDYSVTGSNTIKRITLFKGGNILQDSRR